MGEHAGCARSLPRALFRGGIARTLFFRLDSTPEAGYRTLEASVQVAQVAQVTVQLYDTRYSRQVPVVWVTLSSDGRH